MSARLGIAAAVMTVTALMAACTAEPQDATLAFDEMYCELLTPESIAPVLEAHALEADDVVDHGGPFGKPGLRAFQCLIGAKSSDPVVNLTVTEGLSEESLSQQQTLIEDAIAEYQGTAFLSAVDGDGVFGSVRFVPESSGSAAPEGVAGSALVGDRVLSVLIRTGPDHAEEFSRLALDLMQEAAANLDHWDVAHPE